MNKPAPHPDLLLASYDFELPQELIAQQPLEERDSSRLFCFDRESEAHEHHSFREILNRTRDGDLLVFNQTRVIPARTSGRRVETGGQVQALFLGRDMNGMLRVLLGNRGHLREGEQLTFFDGALSLALAKRRERGLWLAEVLTGDPTPLLDAAGRMPLPPYIRRDRKADSRDDLDRDRYQTVYAGPAGAVAAPTAGLHFTKELISELSVRGVHQAFVTLHVGLGTFQPIECEEITSHRMHEEWFEVPEATADAHRECRARGGRVLAIGTTSVRSLQAAWNKSTGEVEAQVGSTRLFLHPPMEIHSIDGLLTNFHLPKSSLLLLVSCLTGREALLRSYDEAVSESYRFFSYGDAMLIT